MFVFNILVSIIVGAFILIYAWFKFRYTYWKRKGVIGPKAVFPEGNFQGILMQNMTHISEPVVKNYEIFKNEPFFGLFSLHRPILVINDLELIKKVLVKDFEYFTSHGVIENHEIDPFSENLFNSSGVKWKEMRVKLTPVFTLGKIKIMFNLMTEVQQNLLNQIDKSAQNEGMVNFKEILSLYTVDIIGTCFFGIDCNSFTNPHSDFIKYGKEAISPSDFKNQLVGFLSFLAPEIVETLKLSFRRPDTVRFFNDMVEQTVKYREENNIERDDFLQQLIKLKNNTLIDDEGNRVKIKSSFTFREMVAQTVVFYLAGYETSSSTTSYVLMNLAMHQDVQDKLRQEIKGALANQPTPGVVCYDMLQNLPYLDMVIEETLRLHPPLNFLSRQCTKEYKLPEYNLTIDKKTMVWVPLKGIHTNPQLYPNPMSFEPERFTKQEKAKRDKCAYMPFGFGPRICIGNRFAMQVMRLALVGILAQYKLSICEKSSLPVEVDQGSLVTSPKDMWLRVQKI